MKACIVVPTIREGCIKSFLDSWRDELAGHEVLVVEDNPEPTFDIGGENVTHYSHADIERDLGKDAWIIPRKTDCVRSYGFWKAWQGRPDMIVTLDDDVTPMEQEYLTPYFLLDHWESLNRVVYSSAWIDTIEGPKARGIPYYETGRELPAMVNVGLWHGVPDLDAPTQLVNGDIPHRPIQQVIPVGQYTAMCGMNLAFNPMLAPAMYFLLMGEGYPFDRFGDIWCGIIAKKILDRINGSMLTGKPFVNHDKASDVWTNLQKEMSALFTNEGLWRLIDLHQLMGLDVRECYGELIESLPEKNSYFDQLKRAMHTWKELFE